MTWKYIPVLNGLLQITVTIAIGVGVGILGIISSAEEFVHLATSFVFNIALPCLITKGIGIGMDFYSDTNKWSFIGVFLILRGIALVIALLVILLTNWKDGRRASGIGNVAVLWLSLTWISTVILGIPILSSTFKDPTLGRQYGILAGVSSFIFQLPLQLLFFECHAAEVEEATARMINTNQVSPNQMNVADIIAVPISVKDETEPDDDVERQTIDSTTPTIQGNIPPEDPRLWLNSQSNLRIKETQSSSEDDRRWWYLLHTEHLSNKRLWLKILSKIIRNPVLIGICIGFALSLSTAGKYLRCPSDNCIEGLGWISMVLGWLGNCVSPLSLFTMGLWLYSEGLVKLLSMQIRKLSLYMISKLIIVPLIMVGLANALKLDDEAGRAAILIATLPISMASFSLGMKYNIGEADLATNVAVGTLLMLPTVLCWNIVLDKLDVYPIALPT